MLLRAHRTPRPDLEPPPLVFQPMHGSYTIEGRLFEVYAPAVSSARPSTTVITV